MSQGLATHGYICDPPTEPVLVADISPDTETEDVKPEIVAEETNAPRFKIEAPHPDVRPTIRPPRR